MDNPNKRRISITLSNKAYNITLYDMNIFQGDRKSYSGFINRIISNYRLISKATISLEILKMQKELEDLISESQGNTISSAESELISKIVQAEAKNLSKAMNSFDYDISIKPLLQKAVYDSLNLNSYKFAEHEYYTSGNKYIKALIEDYAKLPFSEREAVYFKDTIDAIMHCIQLNKGDIIEFTYTNRGQGTSKQRVRPYKLVTNTLYNYLVALPAKHNPQHTEVLLFRISRIKIGSVETTRCQSRITINEKKDLEDTINKKGIDYLTGDKNTYEVLLSPQGELLYKSILHLRPIPISEPVEIDDRGKKYTFYSSEEQIKNYFFQYGKEAIILSPTKTAEIFKEEYRSAYEAYDKLTIQQS